MNKEEWLQAYLAKVHELTTLDGYCFERHAVMGLETCKLTSDLQCVLDNGEPLIIVRIADAGLAERICRAAIELLDKGTQ